MLLGMLNSLIRAASAAQRVFEIIDLVPDIPLDGGEIIRDNSFHLEFKDVVFAYPMRTVSPSVKHHL